MVTSLSVLTSLKTLTIRFESPLSRPDQVIRPPPPPTRTFLTLLSILSLPVANEYLMDFVAQIDTPRQLENKLLSSTDIRRHFADCPVCQMHAKVQ